MTANYKTKSGSSSGSGESGGGNNTGGSSEEGGKKEPSGGSTSKNGTTVIITKNGISNSKYISVVINGATDDFVVKIQESSDATEKAMKALMTKYSDLSYISYFPMNLALYDATGNTQITDTTGLSMTVTVPIPDSMIPYGTNNKVAYVGNERLEEIPVKYTNIGGVACMTFTTDKFNPPSYCIYVDTENLSQGTIIDETPKTGDGIHPKWFLSIGLLFLSLVCFLKKDRKKMIPA